MSIFRYLVCLACLLGYCTKMRADQYPIAPVGSTLTISVDADGTYPFTYQWKKNGVSISAETDSTLAIVNAQLTDSGDYTVQVTNPYGSVPSDVTHLTIGTAPAITGQPAVSQTVTAFDPVTFSVTATGIPAPTYQWKRAGVDISGATGSSLTLSSVTVADAGIYTVVVSNGILPNQTSNNSTLIVNKKTPSITTSPSASAISYGQALSQSTLSGGAASTSGTFAFTNPATVPPNAGTYTANITFNPTDTLNYASASGTTSVSVSKLTPTVSWAAPASIAYGTALSATQLNATASVAGTFTYSPASGTILNAGAGQSLGVTFTPTDTTNYNAAVGATTITVTKAAPTITWGVPAPITYGTSLSAVQLNATASTPGTFSYSPSSGTVLSAGAGQNLGVTFSPTDSSNFTIATKTTTITVNKANQTITFGALAARTLGSPPFALEATSGSGLIVTYVSSTPSIASVSGNTVTIAALGSTTITASQAGNSNYLPAADVPQILTVNPPTAAPVVNSVLSASGIAGYTFNYSIAATNFPTSYSATGLPSGLSINTATGVISGTPTSEGTAHITISATNMIGTGNASLLLTVSSSDVPPVIITQPSSKTVTAGDKVVLFIDVNGIPTPSLQWFKNGTLLSGATATTLIFNSVSTSDAGTYSVVASNASGTVTSADAVLTVNPPKSAPSITVQPVSQTVMVGDTVNMSVSADGFPSPTYQWRKDLISLTGQVVKDLTINKVKLTDAGDYDVIVSNESGSVTSSAAHLIVKPPVFAGQYFGSFSDGGSWALNVLSDNSATYIAYLPGRHSTIVVNLSIANDGSFSVNGTETIAAPLASDRAIASDRLDSLSPARTGANAVGTSFTLTGTISNGVLTGNLSGIGQALSASIAPASGPAQAVAGLYTAVALNGATGTTFSIVGASGQIVTVTMSGTISDGSVGTTDSSGKLATTTVNGASLSLSLNSQSHTIAVTYQPTGSTNAIYFEGTSVGAVASSHLAAVSMRANVGNGDQTLIVGFVIGGAGTKRMLIRGVGPTLSQLGVTNALPDPYLKLFNGSLIQINSNDNWGGSTELAGVFSQVSTFPLPATSKDAALLTTLPAGPASAHVTATSGSGIALAEFYDADSTASTTRLSAVSGRAQSGLGDDLLMLGFVITGNAPMKVLVRGIGPTLTQYQINAVLADPKLELYDISNRLIDSNDNWGGSSALSDAFALVHAAALPANSKDSALIVTLQPGVYYAHVRGVGNTTGVALVEVFEIP